MFQFNRRTLTLTLIIVMLGALPYFSVQCYAQEAEFNARLFVQLSHMLKTKPPTKVTVEIKSAEDLLEWYRTWLYQSCMNGRLNDPMLINVTNCAREREFTSGFVYGRWIEDQNDPGHLHIQLVEHTAVRTRIHEYMHWYLHYSTVPHGLINREQIIEPLTVSVMTSPQFMEWLDDQ